MAHALPSPATPNLPPGTKLFSLRTYSVVKNLLCGQVRTWQASCRLSFLLWYRRQTIKSSASQGTGLRLSCQKIFQKPEAFRHWPQDPDTGIFPYSPLQPGSAAHRGRGELQCSQTHPLPARHTPSQTLRGTHRLLQTQPHLSTALLSTNFSLLATTDKRHRVLVSVLGPRF